MGPPGSSCEMPVLVVSGAYDRSTSRSRERMVGGDRRERRVATVVASAVTRLHLERPDEVAQLLISWLETA